MKRFQAQRSLQLAQQGRFTAAHPLRSLGFEVKPCPVSVSGIQCAARCKRKFFWRYRLGLVRRMEVPSAALTTGTFVHEGLQKLLEGGTLEATTEHLQQRALGLIDRAARVSPDGAIPQSLPEIVNRAYEVASAMVGAAWSFLRDSAWGIVNPEKFEVLACERPVLAEVALPAPFRRTKCDVGGVLDLVVQRRSNGTSAVVDWKTCGRSTVLRSKCAEFEPATTIYPLLAEIILREKALPPPQFFYHVFLLKPTIRLKKSESLPQYADRVRQWYKDKQMADPNDPPLLVSEVRAHPGTLTREEGRMLGEQLHLCRLDPDIRNFPRNGAPAECVGLSDQGCPYLDLCRSDPVLSTELIAMRYQQDFRSYTTPEEDEDPA
jgi:hypothetical protein